MDETGSRKLRGTLADHSQPSCGGSSLHEVGNGNMRLNIDNL